MTARPFRDLCPDAGRRDALSDNEFWAAVLEQPYEPFDDGEPDRPTTVQLDADPCTECGETGACAYDSEGRALIHAKGSDDDD